MLRLPFNEEKATQAAARFLSANSNRLPYLKLIKLLYFLDREALLRWGRPVTTDRFVAMPHGPVVSQIYNLICDGPEPVRASRWHASITKDGYDVFLSDPTVATDELSRVELRLIDEIANKYAGLSKWQVRDLSHDLPEWADPQGSSFPIEYEDILRAEGRTEHDVRVIIGELENLALVQSTLPA